MFVFTLFLIILNGMVIRDDVDDSQYRADENDYPEVFYMWDRGECAGTLIAVGDADFTEYGITAAHCFCGQSINNIQVAGVQYNVEEVFQHPCFSCNQDGPNGADVAIIKLTQKTNFRGKDIYTGSDESGKEFTLLGWGDFGVAGVRPGRTVWDKNFRRGNNVVVHAGETIRYRFDGPPNALPLEAVAWSGDSGGPALLNDQIIGVNSGGDCCDYGVMDEYSRLSSKLPWIQASIAADSAQSVSSCQRYFDDVEFGLYDWEIALLVVTGVLCFLGLVGCYYRCKQSKDTNTHYRMQIFKPTVI